MKKKYLFSMAAAAMMLAACSSEDVVAPATNGGAQWNAEGQGYISLAINLPTQPQMTKAFSGNEVLDDGTPEEYDVNDATLILFKGGKPVHTIVGNMPKPALVAELEANL